MDVPRDQIASLLDLGLYDSAQMLVLLGDSLYGEKEHKRAIYMYKQALNLCKIIPKQTMTSSRGSLSTSNRSSSPNSVNVSAINENEVKFKITLCHSALNDNRAALVEMEGIPSKARTLRMNLTLAKLYRYSRHSRAAISCYKECLRHCPYILEAITALAELGVAAKDILTLFPQTPSRSGRPPFDNFDSSRWLQPQNWRFTSGAHEPVFSNFQLTCGCGKERENRFVEAQCCIASNDYKGGLELFAEILQRFPSNVHILLEVAKVEAIIGKNDEAMMNFEKARSYDPYVIDYMDEYAMLLKTCSDSSKLNRLVHDLLSIDPTRPEVCVALSVLWERKDERRAMAYVDKCLRIDDRHIAGHIMKGNLFLSLGRPDNALASFRAAQELRPDLRSYQGLVRSYLSLAKTKEALHSAREAMKAMPQSAKALKLVGDVHASITTGREKAKKFYESALRLEPGFLGAALALAELHVVEGRNGEAVTLLERYLKDWADDSLHIKLAQVFAATNMLQEALSHFQAAMRINPQNETAKKGLERLEKQMKGVDPDAPEEDEDNEVEDAEGEQEEAELL
ncbi:hypothetical protein C5167_043412 [Papaver somniferum]|uniref:Anaphase-promoting complex subunit 7 n=1 Tax=Papaver somniferum TaxID=3469 RepID=A0A4Y7L897_PAPSO|nr:hypothetical protein C5167_043412 [Papaver somniferum]